MDTVNIGVNKNLMSHYDTLKYIYANSDNYVDNILNSCNFNTKEYNVIFLRDLVLTAEKFENGKYRQFKVKKFM